MTSDQDCNSASTSLEASQKAGVSDADRALARALAAAFLKAEIDLGIDIDGSEERSLLERSKAILEKADSGKNEHGPLEPRLYELVWFVRRTCLDPLRDTARNKAP
jgi:hypothetical protein